MNIQERLVLIYNQKLGQLLECDRPNDKKEKNGKIISFLILFGLSIFN